MAEFDTGDGEMAESRDLMWKARNILATPSHTGLEILVNQLNQETVESQSALTLYDFCVDNFPNCLTLMLLKVYRDSSDRVVRFRSIHLLADTLAELSDDDFEFSLTFLHDIKPLLISCLKIQETEISDFSILRRIVSNVALNVMILGNDGWDELSDCIVTLTDSEPLKAFHVFVELPPLYSKFFYPFIEKLLDKIYRVLANPEQVKAVEWILALGTGVKMVIQLLDTDSTRYCLDFVTDIFPTLVKAVNGLVDKGMEELLRQALHGLQIFLEKDTNLYNYNKRQYLFVSSFAFRIKNEGKHTKEVVRILNRLVKYKDGNQVIIKSKPSLLQSQSQEGNKDHVQELDRSWLDHLKMLTPIEILNIFASINLEERSREMAIRRLNDVLSDHTLKIVEIDASMIRELQPLVISCLWEERITESMFKVLGQVVYHVAHQMFSYQYDTWDGLTTYVVYKSKTDFERAVYIFQCVPMPLENEDIVLPMINNLLPEIGIRLNPPRDLLVDNSGWVLAFTGAFCAMIHLIEESSHYGKEITDKMIESVKVLVKRGMEVGIVRRAFRDLERLVDKHLNRYGTSQYKFVKGLLWKLYEIRGMKMESKMVLWRINMILEKGLVNAEKKLPENDLDWLSSPID